MMRERGMNKIKPPIQKHETERCRDVARLALMPEA
jgi:hypothetical protein